MWRTLFEIALCATVLVCVFNEKKIATFERKLFSKIRGEHND